MTPGRQRESPASLLTMRGQGSEWTPTMSEDSRNRSAGHETRCLPFPARVFRGTGRKPHAHDRAAVPAREARESGQLPLAFPDFLPGQRVLPFTRRGER